MGTTGAATVVTSSVLDAFLEAFLEEVSFGKTSFDSTTGAEEVAVCLEFVCLTIFSSGRIIHYTKCPF